MREQPTELQPEAFRRSEFEKLAHILYHLRQSTKNWENVYGHVAKEKKKAWEKQADEWLQRNIKQ